MKLIIVLCAVVALALAAPYDGEQKKNYKPQTDNFQGYHPRDYEPHHGKDRNWSSDESDNFDSDDSDANDSDSHSGSDEHGNKGRRPAPGYGGSISYGAHQIYRTPNNKRYEFE